MRQCRCVHERGFHNVSTSDFQRPVGVLAAMFRRFLISTRIPSEIVSVGCSGERSIDEECLPPRTITSRRTLEKTPPVASRREEACLGDPHGTSVARLDLDRADRHPGRPDENGINRMISASRANTAAPPCFVSKPMPSGPLRCRVVVSATVSYRSHYRGPARCSAPQQHSEVETSYLYGSDPRTAVQRELPSLLDTSQTHSRAICRALTSNTLLIGSLSSHKMSIDRETFENASEEELEGLSIPD